MLSSSRGWQLSISLSQEYSIDNMLFLPGAVISSELTIYGHSTLRQHQRAHSAICPDEAVDASVAAEVVEQGAAPVPVVSVAAPVPVASVMRISVVPNSI